VADYQVHGIGATLNEFNVALALDKLHISYMFQWIPYGLRNVRGTYKVDFYLPNIPGGFVLEVYGEYWHTGQLSQEDKLRLVKIRSYLGCPVEILWGVETETPEKAYENVRKKVGVSL
jgi:hypothetical protein